jgi:hypothetical protein
MGGLRVKIIAGIAEVWKSLCKFSGKFSEVRRTFVVFEPSHRVFT